MLVTTLTNIELTINTFIYSSLLMLSKIQLIVHLINNLPYVFESLKRPDSYQSFIRESVDLYWSLWIFY